MQTMTIPHMEYRPEGDEGLVARWHGGEYIEIGYVDEDGEFRAQDIAANAWDYAAGKPREEFVADPFGAMRTAVDHFLAEQRGDEGD